MEFLLIVLALSFVIQLLVLSATEQLSLRLLGAALMEMIPVSGMIYYTAARPDGLLFGWGGNVVLLLWTAGAVLLGCAGAWLLSWIKKRMSEALMYLHLGQSVAVPHREILGIFDLDNASWAYKTREFLERAEQEGRVISVCDDLPRSFVLVGEEKGTATVYISQLSSAALLRRAESNLL